MSNIGRILPWRTAAMLVLIVFVALGIPSFVVDLRANSDRSEEWIQSHTNSLPSNLDELWELPLAYQQRAFQALAPETQSDIMRDRLQRALSAEALSLQQRAALAQMLSVITPDIYRSSKTEGVKVQALCKEYGVGLPPSVRSVLVPGGQVSPVRWSTKWPIIILRISEAVRDAVALHASQCTCSSGSACTTCDWYPGQVCAGGSPGPSICEEQPSGCGCFWQYPCDGLCIPVG